MFRMKGGKGMSVRHYHGLCQRYRGRAVEIRTHGGRVHRGIIDHVTPNRVYLRPLTPARNLGGFGYGGYRWGYGGGWGFGWGLALGTIAGLALIPFFLW